MIDLRPSIAGSPHKDVVDAVYFAIRYVKQAATAHRTGKDIFQDANRSAPSLRVRQLAMALVQEIERQLGISAAQFQSAEFNEAMNTLSALPHDHSGTMTKEERAEAEALAAELSTDPLASSP